MPRPGRRALPVVVVLTFVAFGVAFAQPASFAAIRAQLAATHPDVVTITPAELERALRGRRGARPLLLDARTEAEFAVSHLRDARRIDPSGADLSPAGTDRGRDLVVYCSLGLRSADVAERLARAGFTKVRNLEGGIFEWANTGRPVVRRGRFVLDVHPYDDTWGRLLRADLRTTVPRATGAR